MIKKILLIFIIVILVGVVFYIYGLPYLGERAFESGKECYRIGQYKKAVEKFKFAERWMEKDQQKVKTLMGYAYNFQKKYKQGEKKFREALSMDPKNDEISRGLFGAVFQQKKNKEAERIAKERLKYSPYKEDVYEELARVYYVSNSLAKAKEYAIKTVYLNDLKHNSYRDRIAVRLLLAGIKYNLEEYNNAINVLLDARSLDPHIILVHKSLGQTYEKVGKKKLALRSWQRANELDRENPPSEFRQKVNKKIAQLKEEIKSATKNKD